MPLERDKIEGHDGDRLAFRFSMLNDMHIVQCQISDAALDELSGAKGTESAAREALFASLRDTIEKIASDLFDQSPRARGYVVRIFTKQITQHLSQQENRPQLSD